MTVIDDDLFEGEEMYCLTLQSSDSNITIWSPDFTCIFIEDDDRKLELKNAEVWQFLFVLFSSQCWVSAIIVQCN